MTGLAGHVLSHEPEKIIGIDLRKFQHAPESPGFQLIVQGNNRANLSIGSHPGKPDMAAGPAGNSKTKLFTKDPDRFVTGDRPMMRQPMTPQTLSG